MMVVKRGLLLLAFSLACRNPHPVATSVLQTAAPGGAAAAAPGERTPANVMSAHGSSWLERPEREAEEKPDLVIAAMRLKDGDVVAEVGAGSGYMARRAARAVAPHGVVYANDIQPEMIDLIRSNDERERIANIVPILGSETDPRLPEGAADWILLVDVYHEFQQPKPMLARMRQALKPGGHVMLVEYRGEGTSAEQIRPEHRMTKEQVLGEWLPAGYLLESVSEALPSQRMFIFTISHPIAGQPNDKRTTRNR
jgi:predicted methyltransferase